MDNYLEELRASISHAVASSIEGKDKIAILFSGGLDSSLIALLAKRHTENANITLYTVGTAHSHDLLNVEEASYLLGLNSRRIEIHSEEIIQAIPKLSKIIETYHPVKISFELPLYLGMANVEEKLLLTGQGADELFGGYARYLKMKKEDLKRAMDKDVEDLLKNDVKMDFKIAEHFGKFLKIPYLDKDVVKRAMNIPVQFKVDKNRRKIILKQVAMQLGLPSKLANKEKKAMQYSSGILKELRKAAKREGMEVNELIEYLTRH